MSQKKTPSNPYQKMSFWILNERILIIVRFSPVTYHINVDGMNLHDFPFRKVFLREAEFFSDFYSSLSSIKTLLETDKEKMQLDDEVYSVISATRQKMAEYIQWKKENKHVLEGI